MVRSEADMFGQFLVGHHHGVHCGGTFHAFPCRRQRPARELVILGTIIDGATGLATCGVESFWERILQRIFDKAKRRLYVEKLPPTQ